MLKAIFKSDHFESYAVRYRKVKSPTELVFGVARLTDRFDLPDLASSQLASHKMFVGQFLLNPPSVEGWHEGEEWVDSGALIERINFASTELERRDAPGIQRMVALVREAGDLISTENVTACLDAMGCIDVSDRTFRMIVEHASGQLEPTNEDAETDRAIEFFQLIASTPDNQYC